MSTPESSHEHGPQPVVPQPVVPQPVIPAASVSQPQASGNGLAIAALVVGILAFLFGWTGAIDLIAAIAAIVLGGIALSKRQSKGMAITGLVLGGIALITAIVMSIIWLAALSQAGKDTKTYQTTKPTTSNSSSVTTHDFGIGETGNFYDISVKATNVAHGVTDKYITPAAGNELIRVSVTIKNISSKKVSVGPYSFDVSVDGVSTMSEFVFDDTALKTVSLDPGATVSGDLVYEVKTGANLKLTYSTYDSQIKKQDYSLAL